MRQRILAAAMSFALLIVAVGGWALAADLTARTENGAPAAPELRVEVPDVGPRRQPLELDPAAGGVAAELATEPGLPPPQAAKHPVTVRGDAELLDFALQHGHGGDGSAGHPLVFEGAKLKETGADMLRFADTRLHVVLKDLHMTGEGDGIALLLTNVTDITVRGAKLNGHHTAVRIENAASVHIEDVNLTGNRLGLHLAGVRDVAVTGSSFAGNAHAVFVARLNGDTAVGSTRVTLTGNTFAALDAALPHDAEPGSGVILTGRAHHVEGNEFSGYTPGGLRINADAVNVTGNRFHGGGHGVIVTEAADTRLKDNDFTGHHRAALISFDGTGLLVEANRFDQEPAGAIASVRDVDPRMTGNRLQAATAGITLWEAVGARVDGNVITQSSTAVRAFDSVDVRITQNDVTYVGDVVFTLKGGADHVVEGNRVHASARLGVYLAGVEGVLVASNTLIGPKQGIVVLGDASEVTLQANGVSGRGSVGIRILQADDVLVAANEVWNQDYGVLIEPGATGVVLKGGQIQWSPYGLLIEGEREPLNVEDIAIVSSRIAGIAVVDGSGHTFTAMELRQNGAGLLLVGAQDVTLTSSHVQENRLGLHFVNSTKNLIYDNHIANHLLPSDRNVLLANSPDNRWNVSRAAGDNIVGGAWIGGNLWHDYDGPDLDQDGIGDLPHEPIPYHPLLEDLADDLGLPMGPFDLLPLVLEGHFLPSLPVSAPPTGPEVPAVPERAVVVPGSKTARL